jgi:hypothetical protein
MFTILIDKNYSLTINIIFIILFIIMCQNIGNKDDDFVDRQNNPVQLVGSLYTKYSNWGNMWSVEDDSPDADPIK